MGDTTARDADVIAEYLATGRLPQIAAPFTAERFTAHAPAAAAPAAREPAPVRGSEGNGRWK